MKKKIGREWRRLVKWSGLLVFVIAVLGISGTMCYAAEDNYIFTIAGETVYIPCDFEEGESFNLVTVNTQYDMEIVLENGKEFSDVSFEVDEETMSEEFCLSVAVDEIADDMKMTMSITVNGETRTCFLNTLNTNMPELEVVMNGEGYYTDYFMSFCTSRTIVQFDNEGNIIYYRCEDEEAEVQVTGLWDFKVHQIYNESTGTYDVYYSYHSANTEPEGIFTPGCQPGTRVIMNEQYEIIDEIEAIATEANEYVTEVDGHEFIMIDVGHYIVEQYVQKTVDLSGVVGADGTEGVENAVVVGGYIQEIKDGEVVFEWLSTDYEEFYTMAELDGDETATNYANTDTSVVVDYFHLNSIAIAPEGSANEGNLLVSARHVNAIMMINRTDDANEDTNDIIWLVEDATSCQHYAQFSDATSTSANDGNMYISVYNNNDDMTLRGEEWSIANDSVTDEVTELVIFPLDDTTGEILVDSEEVKRITLYETGTEIEHYSFSCGSLQYVMEEDRDIATIGWGNNSVGDTYLSEVFIYSDGTTEINFEISYPEGALEYMSYRSVGANIERDTEQDDAVIEETLEDETEDLTEEETEEIEETDEVVPETSDLVNASFWSIMIVVAAMGILAVNRKYKKY